MAEVAANSLLPEKTSRFLTFRVNRRLYALAADSVREVIRPPLAARVPQAPKALLGIANLRGTILPLVSLHKLLGLTEHTRQIGARAIVLDGAFPTALEVDSVESLVTVPTDRVETSQAALAVEAGEKITGAFEVRGLGFAKVVDVKTLLDLAFAERAKKQSKASARPHGGTQARPEKQKGEEDLLVTFDVAEQNYALALSAVREIVQLPDETTAMPRSEDLVVGMMAFRDQLLPLLSLRGLLGLPPKTVSDGREKVVVTTVGNAVVGLVADRARAVIAADRNHVDPIPSVLAARTNGEARVKAIYRSEGGQKLISILAPDQLFHEDVMQRLGHERDSKTISQFRSDDPAAESQFLVFRLGDDEYGLPIEAVDEVAQLPGQITRVPKTPKFLEGVVNLRGQVLPVVDQRKRFDMPKLEQAEGRRLVVVRTDQHRAGLIVDSVSQVLRVARSAIEPAPDLTGDITRLVHGVASLGQANRIVLLLDPAELLTRAERGLLDAFEKKAKAAS